MSLLLDALRKAEQERRLGQPPSVLDAPAPVPTPGAARWSGALVRVGLLTGVVAVLVWALGSGPHPVERRGLAVSPEAAGDEVKPAALPRAAVPLPVPTVAEEWLPEIEPLESLADLPLAPVPAPARRAAPAAEPERLIAEVPAGEQALRVAETAAPAALPPAVAPPTVPAPAAPGWPRIADLPPAQRQAFPEPRLDVHVYNEDPQRRFVLLDGQRYREGDRVGETARVARILPEGVVLEAAGIEALLPRP